MDKKTKRNRNLVIIFGIILIACEIFWVCDDSGKPKMEMLDKYKGYMIVDKQGSDWISMEYGRACKVWISKNDELKCVFTTPYSYNKWNVGETIK